MSFFFIWPEDSIGRLFCIWNCNSSLCLSLILVGSAAPALA